MSFPETTPVRAVPGAFLNTPAVASRFRNDRDPVSRNLFQKSEAAAQRSAAASLRRNSSSGSRSKALARAGLVPSNTTGSLLDMTGRPSEQEAPVPVNPVPIRRVENIPPVVRAARAINGCLAGDENFPDIDSYCRRKNLSAPGSLDIQGGITNVCRIQRARHPTTKSPSPTPRGRHSTKFRCIPFRTKSSITIIPASYRH